MNVPCSKSASQDDEKPCEQAMLIGIGHKQSKAILHLYKCFANGCFWSHAAPPMISTPGALAEATQTCMQLEGVQSATAGKSRDEVTHIGVMRRKLSASLSKLRPGGNRARIVKPTANNLAAAAAAAQADSAEGGDGLGEESVHAGEQLPDSSVHAGTSSSGRPPFARVRCH